MLSNNLCVCETLHLDKHAGPCSCEETTTTVDFKIHLIFFCLIYFVINRNVY